MNCQVTERVFEIINLLQDDNRQARDYGNGILLYHSEVVFLDVINLHPNANVSRLSELLGITKGAVTQAYNKLCDKGLIDIYKRSDNKKEKFFKLTSMGESSRIEHQKYHKEANQRLCHYFSSLDEKEAQVVLDFLEHLKNCVPFCEFPCSCGSKSTDIKEEHYESEAFEHQKSACSIGNR